MTRITGPSLDQLDRLGDDYAGLVAEVLARTANGARTADATNQTVPEDLVVLRAIWAEHVDETLLPALGVAFEVGAATIRVGLREATGLTAAAFSDVPATSDALAEQYLTAARNRLVGVGDELWSHAREELLEGLQAGESVPQLAARVRRVAPDLTEPRAVQIARTEVLGAVNAGALEQVLATGATGTKRWLATEDSRTRHTHDLADNDTVALSSYFTVGGFPMQRPHDPAGPPQETISCRCALAFDLDLDPGEPVTVGEVVELEPEEFDRATRAPRQAQKRDRSFLARVFADGLAALVGWFKARTAAATLQGEQVFDEGAAVTVEHFRSRMITEGLSTGLRTFAPGSLMWRDPPFALRWQDREPEMGGHANAVHVGNVARAERQGNEVWGYGPLDLDSPDGLEFARKLASGFARWVSIGLDEQPVDVEVVLPEESAHVEGLEALVVEPDQLIFHSGRIGELTAVTVPAQAEAFIEATPALLAELRARGVLEGQDGPDTIAAAASLDGYRPPAEWFTDPALPEPTGIVVGEDGRVYGHAALSTSCHIGFADQCVSPPHEADHPYFLTGEVVTADGSRVPVGQVTLATGHAPLSYGAQKAAAHYDDTGSVVADVTCGNDQHGIWVAGAVRPGTDPARVHELRASGQLSGDWRRIGGQLRLVALLAVNVPGFPVPRPRARVASGSAQALVAAGKVDHDAGRERPDLSKVKARIARPILKGRRAAAVARVRG